MSMSHLTQKPWLTGLAVFSAAALTLTACGDGEASEGETAEAETQVDYELDVDVQADTLEEGVLKVCSDTLYPPFEYYDDEGNLVGFDMDLAAVIAEALDSDLEIIESSWEGLESGVALSAEDCDLTISGMTITEERSGNMHFSQPYLDDNLGVLATADSGISGLSDLGDGATVGVQSATTGHDFAREEGIDVTEYDSSGLMLQGLEAGQVEAILGNISILGYQAGDDETYQFVEEIDTGEQLGIAASLENQQLIDAVNEILEAMESQGVLEELEQAWFHSETPEEGDAETGDDTDEDTDTDEG